MSNRTLTINISVSAREATQAVTNLRNSLRDLSATVTQSARAEREAEKVAQERNRTLKTEQSAIKETANAEAARQRAIEAGMKAASAAVGIATQQARTNKEHAQTALAEMKTEESLTRAVLNEQKARESATRATLASVRARQTESKAVAVAATSFDDFRTAMDRARREAYAFTIAGFQVSQFADKLRAQFSTAKDAFVDFDYTLRRAANALDIFVADGAGSAELFNGLKDAVLETAKQTRLFKPEEIAKGYYFWASATGEVAKNSADLARIQGEVLPIMQAAAMTDTDMEQALKGVVGILRQFNLDLTNSADVTQKLYFITQKTAVEYDDLLNSFKMVGPVAAANNVSFDEMVRLFGAIGDAGIKGTMAGRAFRQMFIRLNKDTNDTARGLRNLTIEVNGVTMSFNDFVFPEGKFAGWQRYLDALSAATRGLRDDQKNLVLSQLATAAELPVLTELVDANTRSLAENGKGVYDLTQNTDNAAQTFTKSWEQIRESGKATWEGLKQDIAPAVIAIGESVTKAFKPIAKTIGDIAKSVDEWRQRNQALFDSLVKLGLEATVFATLAGGALLLTGAFKLLGGAVIPDLIMQLTGLRKESEATATAMAVLHSIAQGTMVEGIFGDLAQTTKAAAGVNVLTRAFDKFAIGLFDLTGLASNVFGIIKSFIPVGAALAVGFTVVAGVVQGFVSHFKSLGGIVQGVGKIVGFFVNIFKDLFSILFKVGEFVGGVLGGVFDKFGGIVADALGVVGNILDAVGGVFSTIAKGIGDAVDSVTGASARKMAEMEEKNTAEAKAAAKETANAVRAATVQAIHDATEAQIAIATAFDESTGTVYQSMQNGIVEPLKLTLQDAKKVAMENGTPVIQSFLAGMFTSKQQLFDAGSTLIASALDGMRSKDADTRTAADAMVSQFLSEFSASAQTETPPAFRALVEYGVNALASASPAVRSAGATMTAALAQVYKDAKTTDVGPAVKSLIDSITGQIRSKKKDVQNAGYENVLALAKGLQTAYPAESAAQSTLTLAISMLTSGNAAMRATGANLVISLANGISSQEAAIQARIARLVALIALLRKEAKGELSIAEQNRLAQQLAGPLPQMSLLAAPNFTAPKGTSGSTSKSGSSGGTTKSPQEQALDAAQQAVAMAEALKKIQGIDLPGLVKKVMPGVISAISTATSIASSYAKQFSDATLTKVSLFSESATKVVGSISAALDAFTKLAAYKPVTSSQVHGILDQIKDAFVYVSKQATSVTGAAIADSALFADSAQKVVASIGAAVDAFVKLGAGYKSVPSTVFDAIAKDMVVAVKAMIAASKGMSQDLVDAAAAFGDGAGKVVKAIGDTFSAFADLHDYVRPAASVLTDIVDSIEDAVVLMLAKMKKFSLSTDQTAALGAFAGMTSSVVKAVSDTYDAFVKTIQFVDQFREVIDFDRVFGWIEMAVERMSRIASGYSSDAVAKVKATAEAVSAIAAAIDAFFGIGKNASQDPDTLGRLVQQALDAIVVEMASFSQSFQNLGGSLVVNLVLGMRSQESLLTSEVERLKAITGGVVPAVNVTVGGDNPTLTIVHVIKDPDGALKAADTTQVAQILSGSEFISNLWSATNTQ